MSQEFGPARPSRTRAILGLVAALLVGVIAGELVLLLRGSNPDPQPAAVTAVGSPTPTQSLPTATPTPGPQPATLVVLVQGLDSQARCIANAGDQNSLQSRASSVTAALAAGLPGLDVLGFSYSGEYVDPAGGCHPLSPREALETPGAVPVYSPSDTCGNIVAAAESLSALIHTAILANPALTVDLIGHSMGGLVAADYPLIASQADLSHVHAIVLLDSPAAGYTGPSDPTSPCPAAVWQQLAPSSSVVTTIQAQACNEFANFWVVAESLIGSTLPCAPLVFGQNYETGVDGAMFGAADGAGLGLVCGPFAPLCAPLLAIAGGTFGSYELDTLPAHAAVWHDPVALETIASAVGGRERDAACTASLQHINAGDTATLPEPVTAGEAVSVAVLVSQGGAHVGTNDIAATLTGDGGTLWSPGRINHGSWTGAVPGDLVGVALNNSYSWLTGKSVWVQVCSAT